MPAPEEFTVFVEALERSELRYCVTGSVASGIWGEPRTTNDIDFVLLLRVEDLRKLRAVFPEEEYYVPPTETLVAEITARDRGMFNLICNAGIVKADIFIAARDPLHLWALAHRKRDQLKNGVAIWVAPPEYVIIRKLEAYREGKREKHIRDVQSLLIICEVDRDFIEEHVARLGLRAEWDFCQPPAA